MTDVATLSSPISETFNMPSAYPHRPSNGLHDSDTESNEGFIRPREIRKRQPAEEGGYICNVPGCGKAFNRQSDLSKHEKYHLPEGNRPFRCDRCGKRFLFQKDLRRHEQTQHVDSKNDTLSPRNGVTHERSIEVLSGTEPNGRGSQSPSLRVGSTGRRYKYQPLRHDKEIRIMSLLGWNDPSARYKDTHGKGNENDPIYCRILHRNLPNGDLFTERFGRSTNDLEGPSIDTTGELRENDIHHTPMSSEPNLDYDAISWTWDEAKDVKSIFIEADGCWTTIDVRSQLIELLQQLRYKDRPRSLWVDSVCIDQTNSSEKSQQVAVMAQVYGNATNVALWVGKHYDNSELAMRFIQNTLSDLDSFSEITSNPQYAEEWKALAALMSRPCFSRRWVVQELSHARNVIVHCGTDFVQWTDFETAVSLFERGATQVAKLFHGSKTAEYDPDFFGNVEAMAATRFVHIKSKLFLRDNENRIIDYRYSLSDVVMLLSSFESPDPHDAIYSVLSLAKDSHHRYMWGTSRAKWFDRNLAPPSRAVKGFKKRTRDSTLTASAPSSETRSSVSVSVEDRAKRMRLNDGSRLPNLTIRESSLAKMAIHRFQENVEAARHTRKLFEIDYSQPVFNVYKQFLQFSLANTTANNLDILCRPWAPVTATMTLPSWIPTFADSAFHMRAASFAPGGKQMARKNHDPLVSQSTSVSSPYNACRSQSARSWRFGDENNDELKYSLFVWGFVLDVIEDIETYSQLGNVPAEWFYLAGWNPWDENSKSRPPEQFWRTLVADRGPDGASPRIYYLKAFEYALQNSTSTTGLEATNLAKRSNPILVEFLQRMTSVVWNRRLFRSALYGNLLGLAPKKAKENDVICVLYGCSVPVVLRKHSTKEGRVYHNFIGECYLHTMMDGRAIEVQDEYNIPTVEFEIR